MRRGHYASARVSDGMKGIPSDDFDGQLKETECRDKSPHPHAFRGAIPKDMGKGIGKNERAETSIGGPTLSRCECTVRIQMECRPMQARSSAVDTSGTYVERGDDNAREDCIRNGSGEEQGGSLIVGRILSPDNLPWLFFNPAHVLLYDLHLHEYACSIRNPAKYLPVHFLRCAPFLPSLHPPLILLLQHLR